MKVITVPGAVNNPLAGAKLVLENVKNHAWVNLTGQFRNNFQSEIETRTFTCENGVCELTGLRNAKLGTQYTLEFENGFKQILTVADEEATLTEVS